MSWTEQVRGSLQQTMDLSVASWKLLPMKHQEAQIQWHISKECSLSDTWQGHTSPPLSYSAVYTYRRLYFSVLVVMRK